MFTEEYQKESIKAYLDEADKKGFVAGMHVWPFLISKPGRALSASEVSMTEEFSCVTESRRLRLNNFAQAGVRNQLNRNYVLQYT